MELKVGQRYKAKKRIGSGAFGDIYHGTISLTLGVDVKTKEDVAIKLVRLPQLDRNP